LEGAGASVQPTRPPTKDPSTTERNVMYIGIGTVVLILIILLLIGVLR
jgi:hypothetical protein